MKELINSKQKSATEFSLEDRKKLCENWVKTGLSKSEFLRRNNLPWSFFTWCKELIPDTKISNKKITKDDNWVQVVPKPKNNIIEAQKNTNSLELTILCNAMVISLQMPKNQIVEFIKELSNAAAVIR